MTIDILHALVAKVALLRKYNQTGPALYRALGMLLRCDFARLWGKLFKGLNGPDFATREGYDENEAYAAWRRKRSLTDADRQRLRAEAASLVDPPRFSVVLRANGCELDRRRSLDSVRRQTYPFLELCANCGEATGDYLTFLDEGDELAEHALSRFAQAIVTDRALDMLYADEDRVTPDGRHVEPFFKPDWSPDYFSASLYTGRPVVYRTAQVRQLGPISAPDLPVRFAGLVGHVPDVLYHRHRPAAEQFGERTGRQHALRGAPRVSIIIASACRRVRIRGERTFYLLKCLESVRRSTYRNYEIVVLHGPQVPAGLIDRSILRAGYDTPFNWARAMNQGAALAGGEHLLFLNDDTEVITPDWLECLLEWSQQPEIGAVGAKLLFPNGRIQHAGIAILGGLPVHPFYGHDGEHTGYFNSLLVPRNCSAVTGACLMTRADVFRTANGFDEAFPLNYNDVDYCLRVSAGGRRIVCTPHARLYHHELGTRSAEARPAELATFQQRWGATWSDPYHNLNLSVEHLDYRIRND